MENGRYAELLEEIAALLEVSGANPFKVRAFERAARVVDTLPFPIEPRIDDGTVVELDGIGKSIAADLGQLRDRGSCEVLDDLRATLPAGILDVLRVQGLGPKKVRRLYEELGISDLSALESAARDGRIAALSGFGAKSQDKILAEVARVRSFAGRHPFARAWPLAATVLAALRALPGVERAEIAGSLRRARETVKDLDFVVAAREPGPVMAAFVGLRDVEEVIAHGETKSAVRFAGGIPADLRVVPPEVFGATLHHFTGSRDHNIAIRARAQRMGLRVSEWGVFREADGEGAAPIACATEEDVFAAVGLPFIAPELREDAGEIELAEQGRLPALPAVRDMRGDLHMHTTASDGRHGIAQMAAAAQARGLGYIAITDHSRSLTIANGLSRERLLAQRAEIAAFNDQSPGLRVLSGLEADILPDGSIDMDTDVLEQLDWVVGSVHTAMAQPAEQMTARIVRAVRSGLISAIGHPTGRLIGQRDPYAYDFDAVLDACVEMGVALEINASPERLDLNDVLIRRVLERPGLWLTVNTDAHSTDGLGAMVFGVGMARRGGAPGARILNTLPIADFLRARRAPKATQA